MTSLCSSNPFEQVILLQLLQISFDGTFGVASKGGIIKINLRETMGNFMFRRVSFGRSRRLFLCPPNKLRKTSKSLIYHWSQFDHKPPEMRREIVLFLTLSLCACKRNAENQQTGKEPQQEVSTEQMENNADNAAAAVDDPVTDSIQPETESIQPAPAQHRRHPGKPPSK